jgi:hypothetical protein
VGSTSDMDSDFAPSNRVGESADQLSEEFRSGLLARVEDSEDLDELPSHLVAVAAEVLRIDGAGVSVHDGKYRVPLGASSAAAAAAERLQFAIGEGPCIEALAQHTEIRVSAEDLARRWPVFYSELLDQSPYRSVVSLPLLVAPSTQGAVDLYFEDPIGAFAANLDHATEVVRYIGAALQATSTPTVPSTHVPKLLLPVWMHSAPAAERLRTWIATGMVMSYYGITGFDALDRLRGYAYARHEDLNQVTDAIINGSRSIDALND